MWKDVDMTFSGTEAWLTIIGSKRLDTDLGMLIPKQGLDIATADWFAKTNESKTINEEEKQQSNTNKNSTNKGNTQQHTKLRPLGEILVNRLSLRVQLDEMKQNY